MHTFPLYLLLLGVCIPANTLDEMEDLMYILSWRRKYDDT